MNIVLIVNISLKQTETNFELGSLLRLHFQRVHNELLLHLSTNYHQVSHLPETIAR